MGNKKQAILICVVAIYGCSATLDFDECSIDADCPNELTCSDEGYCVTLSSLYNGPSLTSDICTAVYGPVEDSSAIMIGVILPTSGSSSGIGLPMEQAVTLAIDHFNERGGIGPDARKIAAILCDSGGDVKQGLEAAAYLEGLGIRGVIGPAFSDVTIEVGTQYAKPSTPGGTNGTVLVSPSATNPAITNLGDSDRLWRVVPSDSLQASAMAQLLIQPESWGLPVESSVVIVHKEGAYGEGLKNELLLSLAAQTSSSGLKVLSYPDPNEYLAEVSQQFPCSDDGSCVDCSTGCCDECWFAPTYDSLSESDPDVVVLIGTEETTGILAWVSSVWEVKSKGPIHWVLSEGGQVSSLFSEVDYWCTQRFGSSATEGGEKICGVECQEVAKGIFSRIRGTAPSIPEGTSFQLFEATLNTAFGHLTAPIYSAHAYDALYVLAYGYCSALFQSETGEITTSDLVAGMRRLQSGNVVDTLPDSIPQGMSLLGASPGASIKLKGASGSLDFNQYGEPAYGPISVWTADAESASFVLTPIIDSNGILISGASTEEPEEVDSSL